jgi:Protein of unknown function (DUF1353)
MLRKPPEPILGSIDGERYRSLADYRVDFSDWLDGVEFDIYKLTPTDRASIPWWASWAYDRDSLGQTAVFIHDFFCTSQGRFTSISGEELRLTWGQVQVAFLLAMILDGVPEDRAFLAFVAVWLGNKPRWKC